MVHAQQHSAGYIPSNKSIPSSNMMCSYEPSSPYVSTAGINNGGNWSVGEQAGTNVEHEQSDTHKASSQSYNGMEPYVENDQPRRWIAQPESQYPRREQRSECRGVPTSSSMGHQVPMSPQYTPSSYIVHSPQFSRSPSYNVSTRTSLDMRAPSSNWPSWDIDQTHTPPLNDQRYGPTDASSSWTEINAQMPQYNNGQFVDSVYSSSESSSTIYTPPPDQTIPLNGYAFPHRFSPGPSPSPSPVLHRSPGSPPSFHGRKQSEDRKESGKSCSHCHATTTPLWRRDPTTMMPLCNACGLYLQQRNKLRPQELIDADDDGSTSDESDINYVGPECSHCHTHHTSVWRRSKTGDQLCNACGVYQRLRGKPRPLSLKRNKIRPRSKHSPK